MKCPPSEAATNWRQTCMGPSQGLHEFRPVDSDWVAKTARPHLRYLVKKIIRECVPGRIRSTTRCTVWTSSWSDSVDTATTTAVRRKTCISGARAHALLVTRQASYLVRAQALPVTKVCHLARLVGADAGGLAWHDVAGACVYIEEHGSMPREMHVACGGAKLALA